VSVGVRNGPNVVEIQLVFGGPHAWREFGDPVDWEVSESGKCNFLRTGQ
jgi:hypothetical protein